MTRAADVDEMSLQLSATAKKRSPSPVCSSSLHHLAGLAIAVASRRAASSTARIGGVNLRLPAGSKTTMTGGGSGLARMSNLV